MNLVQLASAALTVSGQTPPINVPSSIKRTELNVNVTAVSGTTPTLDVFYEGLDDNGVWFTLYHGAQITAVGDAAQGVGDGMQTPVMIPDVIRVRWVVGGTTPSFTASISVTGQSEL
jgi:hypothetical protein